jgi:DNA-binding transcriptional MerR regulator
MLHQDPTVRDRLFGVCNMTNAQPDVLTIREMCEAFDVTPRTLRFYEAKELLFPIRQGTRRLFGRRDRARLVLILRGKRFGFSLEDIRQLLDMYHTEGSNQAQLEKTLDLGRARLAQMQAQYAELEHAITDLMRQLTDGEHLLAGKRRANEDNAIRD